MSSSAWRYHLDEDRIEMVVFSEFRASLLFTLLLCGTAVAQDAPATTMPFQDLSDPTRGRIEGLVVDERGQPLADATVTATPSGHAIFGMVPHVQTDTNGRFAFAGLTPGPEYLSAFKESAFYPKWVFGNPHPGSVSVDLPRGGAISDIVLQVAPAARLVVRAVNARTGAAIDSIAVHLEGGGAPDQSINGSRMDHAWLVPTVPFRVRVDADGFESAWCSGDQPAEKSSTLLLAPRETLTIIVSLTPTSKQP